MQNAAVSEPAQLPDLEQLRKTLLHAYAAHWLGLVPEGTQPEGRAVGQPAMSSLIRQPIGSRLPLPVVCLLPVLYAAPCTTDVQVLDNPKCSGAACKNAIQCMAQGLNLGHSSFKFLMHKS